MEAVALCLTMAARWRGRYNRIPYPHSGDPSYSMVHRTYLRSEGRDKIQAGKPRRKLA